VIKLVQDVDYIYMILIAGGVGAIGGLGAELLLKRADNTGTIEVPHRLKGTNLVDIGFPASLILGAIAAVAVLYFFPPVVEKIATGASGEQPKVTNEYNVVKLIALALIVGSAGPAFLATAQSRLMSALNAQKLGTAVDAGKSQIDQIVESAKAAVPGAVQQAVTQHIPGASAETLKAVSESAAASLGDTLEPQVQVARDQIDALAPQSGQDDAPAGERTNAA